MLQMVFFADSADVGLRGPLLDGALLQLLPLGLSTRLAPQNPQREAALPGEKAGAALVQACCISEFNVMPVMTKGTDLMQINLEA